MSFIDVTMRMIVCTVIVFYGQHNMHCTKVLYHNANRMQMSHVQVLLQGTDSIQRIELLYG